MENDSTPFESAASRPELYRVETEATLVSRHASVSDDATASFPRITPRRTKSHGQAICSTKNSSLPFPSVDSDSEKWQSPTTGIHSKLFQTLHDQPNVLLQSNNLAVESSISLLQLKCNQGAYLAGQNTTQVETALAELEEESPCGCPRLLALFVKLEKSPSATFGHRASISETLVNKLFSKFDMHQSFLGDLIGRPDYWSASGRTKSAGTAFDFFCQHPRWAQTSRYEKVKGAAAAMQGHRAPCSVYMHHSKTQNFTLYVIAASESEEWFPSVLDRIGIRDGETSPPNDIGQALASSPFMLHAILSTIAFEQSIGYVAKVRDRLMTQIKQVNDYSDQDKNRSSARLKSPSDRAMLENITRELHSVSQTADTGIANAHMSIKIAERMLEAHSMFVMPRLLSKGGHNTGEAVAVFVQDTHHALEYVRNSFYCQRDWLSSYKARKDTAMNFVFNVVTQHDSATNVDISYRMAQDSSSMNAVTILTLIFLPGTFLSTVFSSVAFSSSETGAAETTDWMVPFIIAACILTAGCWSVWYFRAVMARWRESVLLGAHKALTRAKKLEEGAEDKV